MANNRLFLFNPENNTVCFIAKGFGDGWFVPDHLDIKSALESFFSPDGYSVDCDFDASYGGGQTKLKIITENDVPDDAIYIIAKPSKEI